MVNIEIIIGIVAIGAILAVVVPLTFDPRGELETLFCDVNEVITFDSQGSPICVQIVPVGDGSGTFANENTEFRPHLVQGTDVQDPIVDFDGYKIRVMEFLSTVNGMVSWDYLVPEQYQSGEDLEFTLYWFKEDGLPDISVVPHYYEENTGCSETIVKTPILTVLDVVEFDFEQDEDYLLMANTMWGGTELDDLYEVNVKHGSTIFEGSQMIREPNQVGTSPCNSNENVYKYFWWTIYTPNAIEATENISINVNPIGSDFIQNTGIKISDDDAEENISTGSMTLTDTDLELHDTGGADGHVGMRFQAITIPQGATIDSAVIQFHVDEISALSNNPLTVTFSGEDENDSIPYSTTNFDLSGRTETTAKVDWAVPTWLTVHDETSSQLSADLKTIVQEVVDRGGWVSGNDLNIMIKNTSAGTDWFDSSWGFVKEVTINSAEVNGVLFDFPLLVSITDTDISSNAQSDCDDIVFTAFNNVTKLNHEIEDCDLITSDSFTAWVNVPRINDDVDTTLWLYYGNGAVSSQENISDTWNDDFEAVWHLNDDFLDSTSNNNDATNDGSTDISAQIADGQDFDGVNDDIVPPNIDIVSTGIENDGFTASAWFDPDTWAGCGERLIAKSDGNQEVDHWWMISSCADDLRFRFKTGITTTTLQGSTPVGTGDGWHYAVATYDGSNMRIYLDGVQDAITAKTGIIAVDNTVPVRIGANGNELDLDQRYEGLMDEVRLATVAHSADWIDFEYCNQRIDSECDSIDIGSQETEPTISATIGERTAESFEGEPTNAPELTVIFTTQVGSTMFFDDITFTVIKLSEQFIDGVDYHSDFNSIDTILDDTQSFNTPNSASISFTPDVNATDWLVLGTANYFDNSAGDKSFFTRLFVAGSETDVPIMDEESEDVAERQVHSFIRPLVLPNSNQTLEVQSHIDQPQSMEKRTSNAIFALNLDKFSQHSQTFIEGQFALSDVVLFGGEVAEININPNSSDKDTVILSDFGIFNLLQSPDAQPYNIRVQADNVDTLPSQTTNQYDFMKAWSNNDTNRWALVTVENLDNSTHSLETDVSSAFSDSAQPQAIHRSMVAFTLEAEDIPSPDPLTSCMFLELMSVKVGEDLSVLVSPTFTTPQEVCVTTSGGADILRTFTWNFNSTEIPFEAEEVGMVKLSRQLNNTNEDFTGTVFGLFGELQWVKTTP